MAEPTIAAPGRGRWRRMLAPFAPLATRPRLSVALTFGIAVWTWCAYGPYDLRWSTCAVLAWNVVCLAFIALVVPEMVDRDRRQIRAKAATQDEGRGFILGLVIAATVVSLAAIAGELSLARGGHGWEKGARVVLAAATVAASWTMVQFIFALHYAHEYYAPDEAAGGEAVVGGLMFPGDEDPDYWDFVHFSVVIGVACQTADVAFTSKALRRIGTVHGVVAFTFNTVVVALTINLLAALL
ncbi:DUF1345 domain-containing protein [Phenylobacterium sp.]|jgi:uncharacterized membrane protein|uniref:DUF1345 domain-containing protein n=1 Tax=Phenylobacterium sp. TaxID=1871053 RepID=UPI002F424324